MELENYTLQNNKTREKKLMKKIVAVTLLLMLVIGAGQADTQQVKDYPQDGMYHPSYAIVYNPSGPSADMVDNPNNSQSPTISFYNGAAVTLIGWLGDWTLVSTGYGDDKIIGYIRANELAYGKDMPTVQSSMPVVLIAAQDGNDFADVRRQPINASVITGKINNGNTASVQAVCGNWYLVECLTDEAIITGFISAEDVALTDEIAPIDDTKLINLLNNPN